MFGLTLNKRPVRKTGPARELSDKGDWHEKKKFTNAESNRPPGNTDVPHCDEPDGAGL